MNAANLIPHPAEALILARTNPAAIERARRVRLMAFDVDGVLTDGRLWYSEQGEAVKSFHVLDGHGLRLLRENGIAVALVTGRQGVIVPRRAAELGISLVYQNARDKAAVLSELAQAENLELDQIGFMGDDIIDMQAMQRVGFAASVPGAPSYVAHIAHWVSTAPGGGGAARECCDLLLAAQGKLGACLNAGVSRLTGAIQ
ncbi:KdsC family phosphatase [Paracandidimonas soli]|uniref:3-deoxy-D-manno-octulosonate 8-phosphate phosphatase KdsC n=1 Tax=Paracandidimonas soli TaxID=1917182 RepID=A0A4R3VCJ5_9BURK|nr:HAD hydrolase family protein [Paracandidimonas soli]TCV03046.1 3-deoxy-D-manno-octulosonate 8-phosphate phosphatase (KDO 8-P phosphatase) [Paracandidimonas soli]